MEKNTVTQICRLQHGDRFYRKSDTKKEVWEVVPQPDNVRTPTNQIWAKKDTSRLPMAMKAETLVVFLRSVRVTAIS